MLSLKDLSLNIPEADYHALPVWSYSMIARYARQGFKAISTIHESTKPTPEMEFGSLFDSILTKGKDTLKEYVVDDGGADIPPAERSVFDTLLAMGCTVPFEALSDDTIDAAINNCDSFCSKYKKPETRLANLNKCKKYYELKRTGKKIVSQKDWDDAIEMARVFRADPYLSKLFGIKNTKSIEYLYQCQFQVKYTLLDGRQVDVKIMPDLLVINHEEKTIQPVDLKTSSDPAYDFPEHFVKMRYDIQGCLYTDVIIMVKDSVKEYSDYTVLPYLFTDISRTDKVPVTYEYDPKATSQTEGFSFGNENKTYTYKNWQTLLSEIIDYEESNATVPNGFVTDGPNDLLGILSNR